MGTPLEMLGDIVGGYQTGNAAKASARIARDSANVVQDQAAREEGQSRIAREKLAGAQFAAAGASGVTADSYAPSIIEDAVQGELDALNVRYGGQVQATGLRNQAAQLKLAGSQAIAGGYVKSYATLEKGVAKAISMGAGG